MLLPPRLRSRELHPRDDERALATSYSNRPTCSLLSRLTEPPDRPQVASLTYRLEPIGGLLDFTLTNFPKDVEVGSFDCRVERDKLTAVPQRSFSTIEEASAALEPLLRAWETH